MSENIKLFLQQYYTDEQLAALLAHCQDGKFSFHSCCCLIGIPTADHALVGECNGGIADTHYWKMKGRCVSYEPILIGKVNSTRMVVDYSSIIYKAENELFLLCDDSVRRAVLIRLVQEEQQSREALKKEPSWAESHINAELAYIAENSDVAYDGGK